MNVYKADKIRNIALLGHGGEGKTTLTEAMLLNAKVIDRMGRVEDGTTVSDYDPEEISRHISIGLSFAPIEYNGHKINIIDAPGYFDFMGEAMQTLRCADSAVIVVGAVSGVVVGTKKAFDLCVGHNMPRMVMVNALDRENADFYKVFNQLVDTYGKHVAAIQLPIIKDEKFEGYIDLVENKAYEFSKEEGLVEVPLPDDMLEQATACREQLIEVAAETDEDLLERYFDGAELTYEEIVKGLRIGYCGGKITPVCCASATLNKLVIKLMENIIFYSPSPLDVPVETVVKNGEIIELPFDETKPVVAQVFKSVADPFMGKISFLKVLSGTLTPGVSLVNTTTGKQEKIATVCTMLGKKSINIEKVEAGDICATTKLAHTNTMDTLCAADFIVQAHPIEFPKPCITMAVYAKKQGDEEKIFNGFARLSEEDLTFNIKKDPETNETVISGLGELHLETLCNKLKTKFNVETILKEPIIPYREAIRKKVQAEGKYKKQSGGHGQYGHCWVEFEPITDGSGDFVFVDKVVGGSVPRQFIPAVEKGLIECVKHGVLSGYPMVGIRCTLYDGSSHSVDSSEMAFKQAAKLAYKKACAEANPVLLEPIYRVEVTMPNEYMGDISGDLNKRRGRILGMNPQGDMQQIVAEVPLYEMFKYATDLRSMTRAYGSFTMEFVRYEEAPANVSKKIIEKSIFKDKNEE